MSSRFSTWRESCDRARIGTFSSLASAFRLVGDLGDFLDAVVGAAPRRALQELDVVDDQQVEAALALQPAGARGELGDGEAAGLVDVERHALHLARRLDDRARTASSLIRPRRMSDEGTPDCSATMRVASCSDDISSEKKPTMPPSTVLIAPSGWTSPRQALATLKAMLVASARLAHARAAGEDDEVRGLQPAHQPVEIVEAGGEAGQVAVALVGGARHVDGGEQRRLEGVEAAVVVALLGELEQPLLGLLDLRRRRLRRPVAS